MQILAQTEYQDLYRITDGVLFVVNKFIPIEYENDKHIYVWNAKQGKYNKSCQDCLKILKADYTDKYDNIAVPKGTVTYNGRPIISTTNKAEYEYQIKTTGDSFSGSSTQMIVTLKEIISLIN